MRHSPFVAAAVLATLALSALVAVGGPTTPRNNRTPT